MGIGRDLINALLGVSAYQPAKGFGPDLDDPMVKQVREALGGNLAQMPTTRLRWYTSDLETAQHRADTGDLSLASQLYRAMRRDGTIKGLQSALSSGVVALPRKFYGSAETVEALKARNGSRSVFDDMFPPSECELLADDGQTIGVGLAELVPVPGRDFPIMIRQDPEFLRFRWNENRWYFMSVAGLLPITPGDSRWILHTPGGRVSPWNSGNWPALGQAFINKQHAINYRGNYSAKLANPARAAVSPQGATDAQREAFWRRVMAWGVNTVFGLPPGWDVKLIESKGVGYEVFQAEIDTSDRDIMVAIAGQVVSVDGGAGFTNMDLHRTIRADFIKRVATGIAYTLNTQAIPSWVAKRWGTDAIPTAAVVEYDIARPKDLAAEAVSLTNAANAIERLRDVLASFGREVDLDELVTRYGIPIKGDRDGDGAPDVKAQDSARTIDELAARRRRVAELIKEQTTMIEEGRDRATRGKAAA